MYEYQAAVIRVIDGDTVDVRIDLGFSLGIEARVRLFGINAFELRHSKGPAAKDRLTELLTAEKSIRLRTIKDQKEKYGRYLGMFIDKSGHEINQQMVNEGHAVAYLP